MNKYRINPENEKEIQELSKDGKWYLIALFLKGETIAGDVFADICCHYLNHLDEKWMRK